MSNIGVVGMGKLGLPVALAIESKGHDVIGYDISDAPYEYIENRAIPYQEEGLQPLLDATNIEMTRDLGKLVAKSDIIFLPIQTPHDPRYEGTTRIPEDRKDFDYSYLLSALGNVAADIEIVGQRKTVAVISTCLPGTYNELIKPNLSAYVDYVYTPQFIAMGTVLDDYLNPEFNLIGVESGEAADKLEAFYRTINNAPCVRTDITTAEGIKVSYNTWITAKTVIANAWGELAERTGMDFNAIKEAWDHSNKRLLSNRYMNAGMSDGGGCHPRDNIAMSWLATKVGMSHNLWEDLMEAREKYEEWHADIAARYKEETGLPLVVLGRSFKPETNIETGSPAVLVSNLLTEKEVEHTNVEDLENIEKAVYFVATQNERYTKYLFPSGSVVIDPFGYIPSRDGVETVYLGRKMV